MSQFQQTVNESIKQMTLSSMSKEELRERITNLENMLQRLNEKVIRANSIQHSGGKVDAEDWSELYQLSNEARAVLQRFNYQSAN